jgi:AAA domain
MAGTGALDELVRLAVSQHWRLVLVGDPRQLQAVGRGGMFDERCRTGRTHHLATIHRFRHRWEAAASLQLRRGDPAALDAYIDHGRVTAGTFDELAAEAARQWIDHTVDGHRVAVVAETNEHVDALNAAIQQARVHRGHIGYRMAAVAGGETAAVGDVVATRRNDRTVRTDRGEPVRNRDHWTVTAIGVDGSLTVSHLDGHGQVTLSADYVRAHVRLGYAATAHGYEGDTVDVGLAIATEATSHRALYVALTRGRLENCVLVVADDLDDARDVLEQVLTNDRADMPAVARRRNLAAQVPCPRLDDQVAACRAVDVAQRRAAPYLHRLDQAQQDLRVAQAELQTRRSELDHAAPWRRRGARELMAQASQRLTVAEAQLERAEQFAAPHLRDVNAAEARMQKTHHDASIARIQERLDNLTLPPPARAVERDLGIDLPGL